MVNVQCRFHMTFRPLRQLLSSNCLPRQTARWMWAPARFQVQPLLVLWLGMDKKFFKVRCLEYRVLVGQQSKKTNKLCMIHVSLVSSWNLGRFDVKKVRITTKINALIDVACLLGSHMGRGYNSMHIYIYIYHIYINNSKWDWMVHPIWQVYILSCLCIFMDRWHHINNQCVKPSPWTILQSKHLWNFQGCQALH